MHIKNIHKFGGSSLKNSQAIKRVAQIINNLDHSCIIVVSAIAKTTDQLHQLTQTTKQQALLNDIINTQITLLDSINPKSAIAAIIKQDKSDILRLLPTAKTRTVYNKILSYGEVWSGLILNEAINNYKTSNFIDARLFLHGKTTNNNIQIDYKKSANLLTNLIKNHNIIVTTGFIFKNQNAETQLLGRNGSDYSATIIAKLIQAQSVSIWSDVKGIFSADPNYVLNAKLIKHISIAQADTLAKLGCPMLHEQTLEPIINSDINLIVRSSIDISNNLTCITNNKQQKQLPIITFCKQVTIYHITSIAPLEVITETLQKNHIDILGSWKNYQGDIEIAVKNHHAKAAKISINALDKRYKIKNITTDNNYGLIALVDHHAIRFKEKIAKIINRDCKDLYYNEITLAIFTKTSKLLSMLQETHNICLNLCKSISIAITGDKIENQQLIDTIKKQELTNNFNINQYINISLHQHQLTIEHQDGSSTCEQGKLINWLDQNIDSDNIILIDNLFKCALTDQYLPALSKGINIISNNTDYHTATLPLYKHIKSILDKRNVSWLCNSYINDFEQILYKINPEEPFTIKIIPAAINNLIKNQAHQPQTKTEINPFDLRKRTLVITRKLKFEINLEEILVTCNHNERTTADLIKHNKLQEIFPNPPQANQLYLSKITYKNNKINAQIGFFKQEDVINHQKDIIIADQGSMRLAHKSNLQNNTIKQSINKIIKETY